MTDYPFVNQNGKKRSQAKEWAGVRAELTQIKARLKLSDTQFRALSPYDDHQGIEEQMYQKFCQLTEGKTRPTWLWQCLKKETYVAGDLPAQPESYLHQLIDPTESIWLGALGNVGEMNKLWFYEGQIIPIQQILAETHYFDEFYFISKKYDWLLCINHHDLLIATGGNMPQKLKSLCESML